MNTLLRAIPKVDVLLSSNALSAFPKTLLLPLITSHLDTLRANVKNGTLSQEAFNEALTQLIPTLKSKATALSAATLRRVINATGVVIHTNLGRSVFSEQILGDITPYLTHYHTLEYDLTNGCRSERYQHCVQLLCELCDCEDALLVNNNAASVLLILNTFAAHKEVIISRGELLEIGGSFRIPEIMESALSILREVGTTNKTYIADYEKAINEQSAMIMKTHKSNFYQKGFVHSCSIKEIITIAKKYDLIDYYDLGSGHFGVLSLKDEPSVQEICKYKPSLLSFSGDKLLGAGQVGIILGKSALIKALKSNPLLRALRVDKFSILALYATLRAYKDKAYHKIPTLSMLSCDAKILESKALYLRDLIAKSPIATKLTSLLILPVPSLAGGGSIPHLYFESYAIALSAKIMDIESLESALRERGVIAYIKNEQIYFDVRTLLTGDAEAISEILIDILNEAPHKQ